MGAVLLHLKTCRHAVQLVVQAVVAEPQGPTNAVFGCTTSTRLRCTKAFALHSDHTRIRRWTAKALRSPAAAVFSSPAPSQKSPDPPPPLPKKHNVTMAPPSVATRMSSSAVARKAARLRPAPPRPPAPQARSRRPRQQHTAGVAPVQCGALRPTAGKGSQRSGGAVMGPKRRTCKPSGPVAEPSRGRPCSSRYAQGSVSCLPSIPKRRCG